MSRNKFFEIASSEQDLYEDLIIESIEIHAQDFVYLPRQLIAKDEILGEDRLSKFQDAYLIEAYIESVDGFEGSGALTQKFGLYIEQSATIVIARRTWQNLIGDDETSMLPNRPAEGDLLYFPLSKGLFEIKYVEDKNPFYQLNKLYTYKITIELFQYGSEVIDTGVEEIDIFESMKTFDIEKQPETSDRTLQADNSYIDDESKDIIVQGFKL